MASKLYPPQIEGILPAFYKTYSSADNTNVAVLTIPFGLNRAVSLNEIYDLQIRLKTVSTNEQICIKDSTIIDKVNLIAYFNLSDADLSNIHEGQFYKAQVCFTSLADGNNPASKISGYWSTVGTIKCVSEPTIQIGNFNANQTNQFTQELIGEYIQDTTYGDSTEKVEYYEFNLWNANNELVLSSGQQLHNSADDISSYASQDVFKINYLIKEETLYYVQYSVKTLNNLTISSPKYQIMQNASVDIESPLIIYCENVFDEGYIKINLYGGKTLSEQESAANGTFLISRGSSKDNYFEWVEIVRFNINIGLPSAYSFKDFTIEQGEVYKYRIQQYNTYGLYSNPVYMVDINDINNTEATVYADFEDMFLYDGKRQLKIRFNPKVSNFKNTIPEQKIETIGSKYPFIFRNGLVNYKEFSVGGLISYVMDNDLLFLVDDEIEQSGVLGKNTSRLSTRVFDKKNNSLNLHEISENTRKMLQLENITSSIIAENEYKNYDDIKEYQQTGNIVRDDKNLTSENITSERFFKLKVLDWLTDGKVKLFKSPTEGNYLVRLLNISMTPQDQLGRMLHNFTCTAYEIAELNYNNLVYYGIQSEQILNLMEYHWESLVYLNAFYNNDLILDSEGFYKYRTNTNTIEDFICEDFAPGDIIRVSFTSQTTKEYFVIGNSGHYNYSFDNRTISEIALKPISTESFYEFNRILTYSYEGVQIKKFDDIKNIRTQTQIGQQYVGPYENLYEQYTINENMNLSDLYRHANIFLSDDSPKFKVLDTEILHVQKRLLIPIYCISSIDLENISNSLSSNLYVLTPYLNQPEYVDKLNLNNYVNVLPTSIINSEEYQYDNIELLKENPDILDIDKPSNIVDIKDKRVLININDQPYPMPIDYHVMLQVFISQIDSEGKNVWNPLNYYYDPYIQDWTNKYEPYFSINEDIPIERDDLISEEFNDNKFYMNLNKIYLTETNDITLTNLGKIDKLELGNGVIADVTFQLQIIDYSLEDDISQAVYNYKQEYLAEKEKYTTNLINYYTSLLKSTSVDSSIVKELNDKKEEKDNLEKQIGSYDEQNDNFLPEYQPLEGEPETPSLIVLKNFLISELDESNQDNTYLSIANKTLSSQNTTIGNIKKYLTSAQPFKVDGTEFTDNEKKNYWCCSFETGVKDATGLNKSNKRWFPKTSIQQEDEYFINDDSTESQEKNKQLFTLLLSKNYNNNNNNNDNTQQFFCDVGLHNLLKILDCRINGRDGWDEKNSKTGKYINIKSDFNPAFDIKDLKRNSYYLTDNILSNDDVSWNDAFISLKDFINDNKYNCDILERKFYDKIEITNLDLENEITNNEKSIKELLRDVDNEKIDFEKNKFKRIAENENNEISYNYYPLADDIQKILTNDIKNFIDEINGSTTEVSYLIPTITISIQLPWDNNPTKPIFVNTQCILKQLNNELSQSFTAYYQLCQNLRNDYIQLAQLAQIKKNAQMNAENYTRILQEMEEYDTQITALKTYKNKILNNLDLDESLRTQYINTIIYKISLLEDLYESAEASIAEGTENFRSHESLEDANSKYEDKQNNINAFLESDDFITTKKNYNTKYKEFIIPYNKYLALSDSYSILTDNEYCYPMNKSDLENFNKIIGLKDIQKIQGQRLTGNINLGNYKTKIDALEEMHGNINEQIKNFYENIEEPEYGYFTGTQNYTNKLTESITNIDKEILNKQSQIRQLSIQIKTLSTMQSNIDNDKPTKENEQNISQKLLQYLKILSKYYNLENGGI